MEPLLAVEDLVVHYPGHRGPVRAVDGLSFRLWPGETYALVGESGCGKSATGLAMLRLVEPGRIVSGSIRLGRRNLLELGEREMRSVRGGEIGMVFQEPAAALNPVMKIGTQVAEAIRIHRGLGRKEARFEAVNLLARVRLPEPERQARSYPHELSGGMQQRVMMAIALSGAPKLLIADEPTTALDVTIQGQLLQLLRDLKREMGLTVLLITHDLGVVAENADRVGVMYAGKIAEEAPTADLFRDPAHPYSAALLRALPGRTDDGGRYLPTLPGAVPDPSAFPAGCRFHPRCPQAFDPCGRYEPGELVHPSGRRASCFLLEGGR